MCGRYALVATTEQLSIRFGATPAAELPAVAPRYNIAPSQANVVVTANSPRRLTTMRWGLVPAWAKEPRTGYSTINARVESVADKPAYRTPLRRQRCLVPASAYYEWQAPPPGRGSQAKQPFCIQVREDGADGGLFAFAGLYDIWRGPDGSELHSYAILTTAANPLLAAVHDRMPVILPRAAEAAWLDPAITEPEVLLRLLQPYPAASMRAYPVSFAVNDPTHDGPALWQAR